MRIAVSAFNRSSVTRTHDLLFPKQALYQTELYPETNLLPFVLAINGEQFRYRPAS